MRPNNKNKPPFPYSCRHKITVFGGHETWRKKIQHMLPGVRFIGQNTKPDELLIRNSDIVCLQPNCICHSFYHKIFGTVKIHGIPILIFTKASAQKCAREIIEIDKSTP